MLRLTALLLAAAPILAAPASAVTPKSPRAFDGRWSIEVVTERGGCDRAYRYAIRIENGEARYEGGTDFTVSGRVAANGAVKGAISRGADRADVVGTLDGGSGSGSWTTSGSTACGGIWRAERRS